MTLEQETRDAVAELGQSVIPTASARRRGSNMATSAIEAGLNAALMEVGARHFRKDNHGIDDSILNFFEIRKTTIIVQIFKDGGFKVFAPVEKTNSVDATIAALKAL